MAKMILKRFKIFLLLLTVSCCNEADTPFCDTCNNFQSGYVIGFDPCTGVYEPNGGEVGFVIVNPSKRDTVVAYNFPAGIYEFPVEYFADYRFNPFFPEEASEDFPVKIKYRYPRNDEKSFNICRGDILVYTLFINNENEVILISVTK